MTKLSPLEEMLFRAWAGAHGVDDHDDPNNHFDYRGLYKESNGQIQPGHAIRSMAQSHNQAMNAQGEGGDTTYPDPYMAQAEMQGNMLKFQGDMRKEQAKAELEDKKMQHKLMLEQLKMQHQSAEKEKDRQMKAQQAQAQAQQRQEQAQMQMQQRQEQSQMQMAQRSQEGELNRQHEMDTMAMQPPPQQISGSQPPMEPQAQQVPPDQMGGNGLEQQLMTRAMQG
jgi:hypothetical protein